ncbi:MAG: MFS transporter [Deltaproteobacteria bacterium]|nr:MAG: MFS transporter [Deltaproteobacteria bacterium]
MADSFSPNERHTLALTAVGHFGAHFAMLAYPTAAVAIARQESLPLGSVLGWSFLGYLIFGLGALPVGFLTDHVRARWVVRTGVVGIGAAMLLVAWAPVGRGLVWALALVGVFASLYHPAGLGLISRTVRARGRALGINGVFGNVGIAAAPIATELITGAVGWRGAYLALGAFLLAAGLAVAFLPISEPPPGSQERDEHHHGDRERLTLFLILMVAMTLGGLSYRANTVAQPAYYAERVPQIGYGVATSIAYVVGTIGQYLGGRVADRYDLRILYLGFHVLSLPFVLAMSVLAGLPLLVAAAGFVFFSVGMQPIENSLVARFTPDRWRSTGFGLKFSVVFGIGALSVRGVEMFIEQYSLAGVFVAVGGVVALLVAMASLLAWRTRGRPILNQAGA